ncbi:hypothetical protein B0H19DRAFT_1082447 [Mycena capillaripes]|nr:hypothetical protein B0H19DRAFT_1082447 [Mycena capillaripes]
MTCVENTQPIIQHHSPPRSVTVKIGNVKQRELHLRRLVRQILDKTEGVLVQYDDPTATDMMLQGCSYKHREPTVGVESSYSADHKWQNPSDAMRVCGGFEILLSGVEVVLDEDASGPCRFGTRTQINNPNNFVLPAADQKKRQVLHMLHQYCRKASSKAFVEELRNRVIGGVPLQKAVFTWNRSLQSNMIPDADEDKILVPRRTQEYSERKGAYANSVDNSFETKSKRRINGRIKPAKAIQFPT